MAELPQPPTRPSSGQAGKEESPSDGKIRDLLHVVPWPAPGDAALPPCPPWAAPHRAAWQLPCQAPGHRCSRQGQGETCGSASRSSWAVLGLSAVTRCEAPGLRRMARLHSHSGEPTVRQAPARDLAAMHARATLLMPRKGGWRLAMPLAHLPLPAWPLLPWGTPPRRSLPPGAQGAALGRLQSPFHVPVLAPRMPGGCRDAPRWLRLV